MTAQKLIQLKHIFYLPLLLLLLTFCRADRDNPWDILATIDPHKWSPTEVATEDISILEKRISWKYEGDSRIEGFKIDRKAGKNDWEVGYKVFSKDDRGWTDENIVPDTTLTFAYRLYAFAGENKSAQTEIDFKPVFPAPENTQIKKETDIKYKLTWEYSNIGAKGFKIDRKVADNDWVIAHAVMDANQTSYIDTNVFAKSSDINISYRIYAYYNEFNSSHSSINTNAALTPPSNLQITQNSITNVTLKWDDNSTGKEGFKVERRYTDGDWEQIAITTKNTISDDSFELNTEVFYRVAAYTGEYTSDYIENSFNSLIPPPQDPTIEVISLNTIKLQWEYNANGHEGFKIDRKIENGQWEITHAVLDASETTYTDENIFVKSTDIEITYRIYAFYNEYISSQVIVNPNVVLNAPSNLQITQNSITSVTLQWEDNNNDEAQYKVERRCGEGSWQEIATTNSSSINDEDFELNTNVYYRVAAHAGEHSSSYIENSFNSLIPAPQELSFFVNSPTSITLNWTFEYSGHTGFKIDRKTGNSNWQNEFEQVDSQQTTYTDNTINLDVADYLYRIYTYVSEKNSEKVNLEIALSKPQVNTTGISDITATSAISGGNVTDDGGHNVLMRGVCWNTTPNPTILHNHTNNGSGTGLYTSTLINLHPGTTYYVRAFASSAMGTSYGENLSFSTQILLPTVSTTDIVKTSQSTVITGGNISDDGGGFISARGVVWSTMQNPTIENNVGQTNNGTGIGVFSSELTNLTQNSTYYVRAFATNEAGTAYGNTLSFIAGNPWTQKADFPGYKRSDAVGLSINGKGYIGLGHYLTDFWEYDPTNNSWTQKANPGSDKQIHAIGFEINGKGYIGYGLYSDFWEYNPTTDSWSQKANFGDGMSRSRTVGFSINGKGYIGTGMDSSGDVEYKNDFWEYDPESNLWTQKADFGGVGRTNAIGFSINDKGYIGFGYYFGPDYHYLTDFWEYDPSTDTWTRKADFEGNGKPVYNVGLSIDGKGYIMTYTDGPFDQNKFWQYNPITNSWLQKATFIGPKRSLSIGFAINGKGFIGAGSSSTILQDFWEYDPELD